MMRENKTVIKRALWLCWLLLIICFIIKLIGGNFFEKSTTNKTFITICNFIDNHAILKYTILYCFGYASVLIYCLTTALKFKPTRKDIIIYSVVFTICFVTKIVLIETNLSKYNLLIDSIILIGLFNLYFSRNIGITLVSLGLNFLFQLISLLTCNLPIKIINDNFLIGLFYNLDIYIMLILYWLYANYYKEFIMGLFFVLFASKTETQIEDYRKHKIMKINEYCDKQIAKAKAKDIKKIK